MNSLILKETQAINMLFEEIYEKEETFENLMTFAGIISVLENFIETATSEELIEIIESSLLQMRTRWSCFNPYSNGSSFFMYHPHPP